MTHRDKLEEFVDFLLEIDMLPYLPEAAVIQAHEEAQQTSNGKSDTADAPELSMRYELVGVSNHMGNLGFGHYTAYTKRGSRWYLCDDSSVREVKPDVRSVCTRLHSTSKCAPHLYVVLLLCAVGPHFANDSSPYAPRKRMCCSTGGLHRLRRPRTMPQTQPSRCVKSTSPVVCLCACVHRVLSTLTDPSLLLLFS